MARVLKFNKGEQDKFELLMQGFNQTLKEDRNPRLASRIHKKIEEISEPKYYLDSVVDGNRVSDLPYAKRALILSIRELNHSGGQIILEDAEFDYLKECIKRANWTNWIAVEGYALEEWLESIKAVNLKELNAAANKDSSDSPVEHLDRAGGTR